MKVAPAEQLWMEMQANGLRPVREYRFHHERRWRFDFAFVPERVAVEVQGGLFVNGAHVRGIQYGRDAEKRNEAQLRGWIQLDVTPTHIKQGKAIEWIKTALQVKRNQGLEP